MTHLSENEVDRFVRGELAPDERRRVVRHFLTGCRWCRARLASLADVLFHAEDLEEAGGFGTVSYETALQRAAATARRYEARHRKEREDLERVLEAARSPTGEESAEQVLALQGWARVEALLILSFEERYRDPKRMLLLALAARLAAEQLDTREHGAGLVVDFQVRAWAELGNAYRVNEQFEFAQAALLNAETLLDEGTGDLLLLARVMDVKASLRSDQRRLGEALDLLEVAHSLYLRIGDRHLAGRALISWGITIHYDGNPREAVRHLREGLKLIDPERDSRIAATGAQALIHALADCGDFLAAGQILLASNLRQVLAAEPLNLLKLRWMEGKVLAGLGKLNRAERVFKQVREAFFLRRREYDAALVGLELAAVWLQQGKVAKVRRVAEETFEILRDLGVHHEAFKAALYLREACRQEAVTLALLRHVHDFLVRLEWQPLLRFAP